LLEVGFVLATGVDEVVDVGEGLGLGGVEGMAGGFVLDEELAGPEEVDEADGAGETLYGLLKGRDHAAGDAEDVEEFVPEGLLVGLLAGGVLPGAREVESALTDFVPRDVWHRALCYDVGCGKFSDESWSLRWFT
jgi:hypothetical protein